jgi:hypothetical protein
MIAMLKVQLFSSAPGTISRHCAPEIKHAQQTGHRNSPGHSHAPDLASQTSRN